MSEIVLIVDDDEAVLGMLNKVILSNGMEAVTCSSGEAALETLSKKQFDLMLLDINMHEMDGFEVIKQVRARGIHMPIIVVSGRKEDYDTLYGLEIGADDYITKPFNPITLGAKVKAVIRRSKANDSDGGGELVAGPFRYNTSTLRFFKNDEEVILTSKENALMKLFLDNVNHIFSKDALYELVWGNSIVDENAIMVYINRLRQKIEDDPSNPKYIVTVRGLGYRFVI